MKNLRQKMTAQINHLIRKRRIEFKFKQIEREQNQHQHQEFSGHASDDNFIY
jgi:hypothetical protein